MSSGQLCPWSEYSNAKFAKKGARFRHGCRGEIGYLGALCVKVLAFRKYWQCLRCYSALNASTGLIVVARRAGMRQAAADTPRSSAVTPAYVSASNRDVSNRNAAMA